MAPYLRTDGSGDEYGDVNDDDLLLAESSSPRFNSLNVKRKQPEDFLNNSTPKKACLSGDPKALTLAKGILKKTWGFADFRLKQQSAITRLIQGDSAVVIFPTGGGKSLVYQVPALAFNDYDKLSGRNAGGGVTLVVSPLIALMKVCFTRFASMLYATVSGIRNVHLLPQFSNFLALLHNSRLILCYRIK